MKKRRKAHYKRMDATRSQTKPLSLRPISPVAMEVQEIDINSLIGIYRELPDSGKAELLDQATPTGSGNNIFELSDPSLEGAHEIMTHQRLSQEALVSREEGANAILVSTEMSRRSYASSSASDKATDVETTVSSQQIKDSDRQRPLPSPPTSESHQSTPAAKSLDGCHSTPPSKSSMKTDRRDPSHAPITKHPSGSRTPYTSYSSMEMEILVPPIEPPNIHKKYVRRSRNFF